MKKLILSFSALVLSILMYAQCNPYFPLQEGTSWAYESFDAKGKLTGKNEMSVIEYNPNANGYTAVVGTVIYDQKGKELTRGEFEYVCEDGVVYIDMRRFIAEEQLKTMSAYEIKLESENLEIPSQLRPGQTLKDGSISFTATNAPIATSMNVRISDRVVEGKENITTPAGSFESFKIKSKSTSTMRMGININAEFSSIDWYAENVGMVRSESYNKSGKLTGYTVLSKKP
ncbi:MAG TPA: hypothetical protein PKC24_03080 [Cyclobacteriaceae bacterium]|nr:hypothetical protein [Cyclobacteriaceae bacterium]